nr:zinc finger, CCHC-type [Tanacetum cinerariifolium]
MAYGKANNRGNFIDHAKILATHEAPCIAQLKESYIKGDRTKHILSKFFFTHDLQKNADIIIQQITPVPTEFTIHCLWPEPKGAPSNERFDSQKLATLAMKLCKYWPNLESKQQQIAFNIDFWKKEWNKHGRYSCLGVREYFEKSLELNKDAGQGLRAKLTAEKIIPTIYNTYKLFTYPVMSFRDFAARTAGKKDGVAITQLCKADECPPSSGIGVRASTTHTSYGKYLEIPFCKKKKSFFEKQKLTGPNFIDGYRQLRLVLSIEDKKNYLEHPIPVAPVAPPGQQVPPAALAAHAAWVKGQKEVDVLILLTMDLEIQRNLAHIGGYDMLQELKAIYSKQAEQELLQTVREFHTSKQEEGQSVSSHVLKMKGYIENLERLGQPVGQNLAVSLVLVSLNKDFDSFVQNYNMHGMGKTMNELHAMIKLHEETLPKKDANPALHAIRARRVQKNQKNKSHKAGKGSHGKGKGKMGNALNNASFASKPKTPPPPKKDNPAKDAICHQCSEVGHWRRNCPVYLAELMEKKKLSQGASTSGIFTIELYSFPSKSWIYDTGCGTHICITTQGLRGSKKLKPGALSLYVGDGHCTAVEAIKTYHLELPSGLVIILNNCHYAPSITRGVISVSRLFDDGFVNRFDDNNAISVSKNNLVYFKPIPRDDSSLLWHCRLGHISKKPIEKLQHDGLLNSIDIESLGKCVSCMSGRVQKNQKNKSHKAGKGSHGKGKGKMGNASNNASFASKPKTPPP